MYIKQIVFLLCFSCLQFELTNGYQAMEMKQASNGVAVGYWGPYAVCEPIGTIPLFVRGFRIKSDGATSTFQQDPKVDRLGVTAVSFYCNTTTGTQITSTVGTGGTYYPPRNCGGSVLKGIQINVNPSQSPDALGVEDVRMICFDGSIVEGLYGTVTPAPPELKELINQANNEVEDEKDVVQYHPRKIVKAKTYDLGKLNNAYWGTATLCTSGLYVCGIQTRVDQSFEERVVSDKRGLTDIIIYCCN